VAETASDLEFDRLTSSNTISDETMNPRYHHQVPSTPAHTVYDTLTITGWTNEIAFTNGNERRAFTSNYSRVNTTLPPVPLPGGLALYLGALSAAAAARGARRFLGPG
jgi:hypothetical protein